MGGRRARSLVEIVGTGLAAQRANFTRAVGRANPDAVAESSAKLLAKSDRLSDVVYYVSQLTDFVSNAVRSGQALNYQERLELARKKWSEFKRRQKVEDDPVITNAVVSALARAIGKGKR